MNGTIARFSVGKCFNSYEDLLSQITGYEMANLIDVAKKHSRTTWKTWI